MASNPIGFLVAFLVAWAVTALLISPLIGVSFSLVAGAIFALGLVFIARMLGIMRKDLFGLTPQFSGLLGIVLVVVSLSMVGALNLASVGASLTGQQVMTAPAFVSPTTTPSESASCWDSIAAELRGTSSTGDINLYDYAADSPLSTTGDSVVFVYESASLASSNSANYKSTLTDTTGATVNLVLGKEYTFAGGNGSYYVVPTEKLCVNTARTTINLKGYAVASESNMQTVIYDETGATVLSSGDTLNGADYQITLGASEEKNIEHKIKVNAANKAYYLCAISTAVGENMQYAKPTGNSAGLFTQIATPLHMKDVGINVNGTAVNMTRSYSVYKLNNPVMLLEFESLQTRWAVKSTAVDPAADATNSDQPFVAFLVKDCVYSKNPVTGTPQLAIDDLTSSESDVGLDETEVSPAGKQTGALIEVD